MAGIFSKSVRMCGCLRYISGQKLPNNVTSQSLDQTLLLKRNFTFSKFSRLMQAQPNTTESIGKNKYDKPEPISKNVQEDNEEGPPGVVYLGTLKNQIRHIKIFSLSTTAMGLCLQPMLYAQAGDVSMLANFAIFSMVGFFTYVTPFLIHSIAKKYVCEMSYDPTNKSYTSTTYTFFLQKKLLTFQAENVEVPDVPGPFTTFIIKTPDGKRTPLFVAPNTFTKPYHYGKLMGYDKPINLHLNSENLEEEIAKRIKANKKVKI